ncbi:MAG: ATP-binding cassette domain-containing protein [Clostridia bacterium]
MIKFTNFSFKYDGATDLALEQINLNINKGDFTGIIGSSGAGKTSLTYAINGVIPHFYKGDFYGEVLVSGLDTVNTQPEKLAKLIGSVFQDIDGQMVASIVEDEILFGLENFGIDKAEILPRLENALETVGISELRFRTIASLSGGQKQKVAIAAIIALKPEVLLLDEPTGELDPFSSRQIFEMLKILNEEYGITVIVVEQKIMLLCEFVKNLIVLNEHKIVASGLTKEVLKQSNKLEEFGINMPRVATLANILSEKGLYCGEIPTDLKSAKKMVEDILND